MKSILPLGSLSFPLKFLFQTDLVGSQFVHINQHYFADDSRDLTKQNHECNGHLFHVVAVHKVPTFYYMYMISLFFYTTVWFSSPKIFTSTNGKMIYLHYVWSFIGIRRQTSKWEASETLREIGFITVVFGRNETRYTLDEHKCRQLTLSPSLLPCRSTVQER